MIVSLVCDSCKKTFAPGETELFCAQCGPRLGTLTVLYDFDELKTKLNHKILQTRKELSHWRYLELLPVDIRPKELHPRVGWTPLYSLPKLATKVGVKDLWIKDDSQNPSGSYKDRASSIAVARALSLGKKVITAASTGNAASSLSLFAAICGLRAVIFVPESAPKAKLTQLLMFGAEVFTVKGSYDQAFDLCLGVALEKNWYCRNTAINPYLSEGKKTAAFEISEQLGFRIPDNGVVSVGDGCLIGGIWKGFCDFFSLGLIERVPRIFGVQAKGAAPLVSAFQKGEKKVTDWDKVYTIADSICVGSPRDQLKALRAVYESSGAMISVSDQEIMDSMRTLARDAGVFAEPAGATAFAGVSKLVSEKKIGADQSVVVLVTGSGLKDIPAAIKATDRQPKSVEPRLESILDLLD